MSKNWFLVEDPEEYGGEPWDFDPDELDFIAGLQARAESWTAALAHTGVGRPEDDSSLLVHLALIDDERNTLLGEWAVHFYGGHVEAGTVCDQLFNLHERPDRGYFRASGTTEELAERCAEWFEAVLERPVSRTEWHHQGQEYATSWHFADTLESLAGRTSRSLAPTPHSGGGNPRVRHDYCVLVRGAMQRQEGPHSPLCPYDPDPPPLTASRIGPSEATPRPSRSTARRWRF
ncbi:hypothetical protein [Streptomyces sp. NPDC056527]|uniref:hypothetical protein n=1 Tax=Streptomyces sp. NPDC056527 TaxID=3345853 RepID=UPI0036A555DC